MFRLVGLTHKKRHYHLILLSINSYSIAFPGNLKYSILILIWKFKLLELFLKKRSKGELIDFYSSRSVYRSSDKLPQVVSLESALVGVEDYKFENDNNLAYGIRKK